MDLKPEEQKAGMSWFIGSAVVSVIFAAFLLGIDEKLTHSDREQNLGRTLTELRTAQSSLPGGSIDPRLINSQPATHPAP